MHEGKTQKAVIATDDKRILLLFEDRNEQALQETIRLYGALCRTVVRNITGSEDEAEECLNDALLIAWNAIPPARPKNYRAYFLKLVRNAAIDRYRANQTAKRGGGQITEALDELEEIIPASEQVERELDRRELLAAITKFLETLPQKQRDIFVRRYWYAASLADLADLFDMRENHVKVTLIRLRKRLQKYLQKEDLL